MAKKYIWYSDYPDDPPEWYWVSGLHDACIVSAEALDFPFDYDDFKRNRYKYIRNQLTLKINAKQALYDNKVKKISFYNYKILTEGITLAGRKTVWWMADRLEDHGEYFTLEIDLLDYDADPEEFTFKIKFESAEVKR